MSMFRCQCPECRQSNNNYVVNYSTYRKVECSGCGHKFIMNAKQTERYEKMEAEWEEQRLKAANSRALIEYNNRGRQNIDAYTYTEDIDIDINEDEEKETTKSRRKSSYKSSPSYYGSTNSTKDNSYPSSSVFSSSSYSSSSDYSSSSSNSDYSSSYSSNDTYSGGSSDGGGCSSDF